MSNKLEQYSRDEAMRLYPTSSPRDGKKGIMEISKSDYLQGEKQDIYEMGFYSCLSLDIAVKFNNWSNTLVQTKKEDYTLYLVPPTKLQDRWYTIRELYQYFLDNVYEP
jgi:hypothetical protein